MAYDVALECGCTERIFTDQEPAAGEKYSCPQGEGRQKIMKVEFAPTLRDGSAATI